MLAENAKRPFLESYQRSVQRKGVPRTETNSGGHPGQASDSEREPGSSNPDCAMRTDRGYWIPAFAGMTGVSAGTRGDDGSVCGMIAVLCVLACARMISV